jgi:hypothetical protein
MNYIVTDKIGHLMSLDTSEKLNIIEPETYEERFPFEDKLLFCYKQGTQNECQEFIDNQNKKIQECLEVKNINND